MSVAAVVVGDWMGRVLHGDELGVPPEQGWRTEAYEEYRKRLRAADYPCFFGQTGELRGEMLYTFVGLGRNGEMVESMRQFVRLIGTDEYRRCSLVAFFEPDDSLTDHESFVRRFWQALQMLHEGDHTPVTDKGPEHPLWEFSFEGSEMFVVGMSPTYRVRRSRNAGPGMVLVFQPRGLFIDEETGKPIAPEVRRRIHKRMLAYDGMPVHPDIGFYGDEANREWKQYALPDDNAPEAGVCPFHTRQNAILER